MFSPIGKKKLLVDLKRVPVEKRDEYLRQVRSARGRSTSPYDPHTSRSSIQRGHSNVSRSLSRSRSRTRSPLIQSIGAGMSSTRNLEYIVQEDSITGEVARRITEVAVRFRRERDAVALQVFNTNSLTYEEFRDHLQRSFRLRFTDEEFVAVCKLFDNDGDQNIDGSEFLVCFTKLASIRKAKLAADVREKQRMFEERQKEEEERKRHELEKKMELAVDYDYSEETKERALAKMTQAAKNYDKNHPAAVSLEGFDGAFLKPAEFKEMLKRTFNLKVTPSELGAIIHEFDKNGDGSIECSEFLITFFKLGFAAREKDIAEQREKQRQLNIEAEEERVRKLRAQEEKLELKVDYDFSEADEARMHAKLREAAKKYDKNHPASVSLEGFDVQFLTPGVFREMLRRTFGLHLTGKELGAAVKTFDKTGDSTIPCRDFLVHFFQVGYAERNKDRQLQLKKQRELNRIAEEERAKKLKAADEKTHVEVADDFSDSDRKNAYDKLRVAASKYDKNHPSSMGLDGFDGKFLTAGVFREMVKRTFNVQLNPKELAALVDDFDTDRNEKVNCTEFLKCFFKMGFEEKFKFNSERIAKQREAERLAAEEERRKQKEKEDKHNLQVDYDFSEDDRRSALEKMTDSAVKYDKNHASSVSLVGFEGAFMTPYVFKDMIFRTFGIKLTPKELGALMKHFDKDGDGTVDCSEFLNSFFRLGFEKRSQWHQEQLEKQRKENREREREAAIKLQEQEEKMNLKLDWDFTDQDLENVKKRMTEAATKYDKNHPASVGLDGFDCAVLPPGVFREMVKRTFNIALSPRELAAMLTMFDADKEGNIKTSTFLTKFMRIGLDQRYKFKRESIERQRKAHKAAKKEREAKIAAQWKRVEEMVDVDYGFTNEDEDAAMTMLVEAATKYDKTAVSSPSLDGFSCVYLGAGAFKEMLKRTFNMNVSGKQLGALVKKFEHPEKENHIDCQMFVINFLQIGFAERRKLKVEQANIQRRHEQEAAEEAARKLKEAEERMEIKVDTNFGEVERRKAMEKLTAAAFKYDRTMPGAVSLEAFDAAYLTPGVFKETLKRTFNLRLEPGEFGAIMKMFDKNGSNKVNTKEFLNEFFRIGFQEREKMKLINLEKNRMGIKLQKQEHLRKLAEATKKMDKAVKPEFTTEEQRSAFEKITAAATKYDKNHPSAVGLDGFDALTLKYGVFRELLKRTFGVMLSDGELAALVAFFDKKNEGYIRSKDFLVYFFKLGFSERNKFHSEQLRKDRQLAAQREREEQEKLKAQWAKMELDVDWNFTEKDKEQALKMVTKAAAEYDANHPAAMSLSAFDGASMTPAVFREMLRRTMNINLTNKELGALITVFDKDGDKTVDCAEFMVKFTTLGFNERDRVRQENRRKKAEHEKRIAEEQAAKEKAKEDKREAYVNYDFTHDEFSSAMEKLKYAASTYDRNHPSAVSLDGFQGASLSPGIFREMLKRTFNIKLTPGELGAAVKFFDSDGDGTIDTAEFLKHFFKLQRVERSNVRRRRIQAEREVQKKLEDEVAERVRAKAIEDEHKMSFGPEDEKSLMKKLSALSENFAVDSSSFVGPMQSLKGPALPPIAFKEVFYRIFLVRLTFPEIGALMSVLDEAGTGSIDGTKFMNAFFRLGRLQEKALFGEIKVDMSTLDCLRPQASSPGSLFESMGSTSKSRGSTRGTTRSGRSDEFPKSRSVEDLRNTGIQASEEDIESFTKVTVGQSWVLPNVVTKKRPTSGECSEEDSRVSSAKKPVKVNGIVEESFDDFEPFIVVPRSPDSPSKFRPNLKEFPMPETGPPTGNNKKAATYKQAKKMSATVPPPKKSRSVDGSEGKNVQFQGITLKKTTLSKKEASRLHLNKGDRSFSDASGLRSPGDPASPYSSKPPSRQQRQRTKKPKQEEPERNSGTFYFPALLSSAPSINLAPVGQSIIEEENMLLYESTDFF